MPNLLVVPMGIIAGILVSAPVGPANLICISRAVRYGFLPAFLAGFGGALGDAVLATIAAFGFNSAEEFILQHDSEVRLVGGVVLVAFGLVVMRSHPHIDRRETPDSRPPMLRAAAGTFAVTVTNPGALLAFAALFSGLAGEELMHDMSAITTVLLILSVFGGAMLWWFGIATLVTRIRSRFSDDTLHRINMVSGSLLMVLGLVVLGGVIL